MVTDGARPIDWIIGAVDFLVLIAILLFELPEWWHKRKINRIVPKVIPYVHAGQKLQLDLQELVGQFHNLDGREEAIAWTYEANMWTKNTSVFLSSLSGRATTAFSIVVNTRESDRMIYSPKHGACYFSGELGDCYQTFLRHLENLQKIMEKPEAYF
jgi:hypothetical protein